MKTAIDSNILFDVFLADPKYGESSKKLLEERYSVGDLIISEVVYGELSSFFFLQSSLEAALEMVGIHFVPMDEEAAFQAGLVFAEYRKRSGPRRRVLADFLVAGHAKRFANCLVTRDRGFYRDYFPALKIIEPKFH